LSINAVSLAGREDKRASGPACNSITGRIHSVRSRNSDESEMGRHGVVVIYVVAMAAVVDSA
jgi:hypothetical protein